MRLILRDYGEEGSRKEEGKKKKGGLTRINSWRRNRRLRFSQRYRGLTLGGGDEEKKKKDNKKRAISNDSFCIPFGRFARAGAAPSLKGGKGRKEEKKSTEA